MEEKIEFFKTPYPGYYVSKNGDVYSVLSKKCLLPKIDKDGYCEYALTIDSNIKYLRGHRIVAETFLPNPENKPTVNHKNGIKNDNSLDNLEWSSYHENNTHRFEVLHCYKPMKYVFSYEVDGKRYENYSLKDCEKAGVSTSYLRCIISGKINTYFMYFEKLEDARIRVYWNGELYKIYGSAKDAANELNMKMNCIYTRTLRHKLQEYITRDYKFTFKINNKENVTTKEVV